MHITKRYKKWILRLVIVIVSPLYIFFSFKFIQFVGKSILYYTVGQLSEMGIGTIELPNNYMVLKISANKSEISYDHHIIVFPNVIEVGWN